MASTGNRGRSSCRTARPPSITPRRWSASGSPSSTPSWPMASRVTEDVFESPANIAFEQAEEPDAHDQGRAGRLAGLRSPRTPRRGAPGAGRPRRTLGCSLRTRRSWRSAEPANRFWEADPPPTPQGPSPGRARGRSWSKTTFAPVAHQSLAKLLADRVRDRVVEHRVRDIDRHRRRAPPSRWAAANHGAVARVLRHRPPVHGQVARRGVGEAGRVEHARSPLPGRHSCGPVRGERR